jgi:predicted dehydrogenase
MPSLKNQLRVAVVGCGQIADAHLQEIGKLATARAVAVCDRFPDLAKQAAERFGVPEQFADLGELLARVKPDVVHITTPPHSHAAIAEQVLCGGAHVYVEKPFTVNLKETDALLAAAQTNQRLICAGHDQLFDPCWIELKRRHKAGELGDVVHVDSVFGYDLTGPFGRVLTSDPGHWIHRLPGGLFHNNISHAVYKVTEFLKDDQPRIWANCFGPANSPPTELRVMLRGERVTATILFSSTARPVQKVVRVFGTRAMVEVDFDSRQLRWSRPMAAPGAFAKLEAPFRHCVEAGCSLGRNLWQFVRGDLQYFAGMNRLFRDFYRAIEKGGASPTPPEDLRRVTAIMDAIFVACAQDAEARL